MKWARIENDKVMEIIDFDPKGRYHPDIEKQFVECDDTAEQHYEYKNKKFSKPVSPIIVEQPKVKTKTEKLIEKLIKKGILEEGEVD